MGLPFWRHSFTRLSMLIHRRALAPRVRRDNPGDELMDVAPLATVLVLLSAGLFLVSRSIRN